MRPSSFVWSVVVVSALALLVSACGADGESRPPTTTIQGELVGTTEEESIQPDEAGGDGEEDEDGAGDERKGEEKGKRKEKDKDKARGQGGNDD